MHARTRFRIIGTGSWGCDGNNKIDSVRDDVVVLCIV